MATKIKKEGTSKTEMPTIKTKKVKTKDLVKLKERADAKKELDEPVKKVKGEKTLKVKKEKHAKAERVSIYNYPADCETADQKKNFRAKARKSMKNFDKQLKLAAKGKGKEDAKKIEKDFASFKAKTFISEEA